MISSIITSILFSFVTLAQTDVKKLLAYSTISNCGFIYFLISINNISLALTYFILHGLLKSLSFLVVGIQILIYHHIQDVRF